MSESKPAKPEGRVALATAFLLGVLALGTAASAYLVDERSTLAVLAGAACLAFAGLVAAFVSLRGQRLGPSIAAILASVMVLGAVAVGFGAVSLGRVLEAVEQAEPTAEAVTDDAFAFRLEPPADDAMMYDATTVHELHTRARAGFWIERSELTGLAFVESVHGEDLAEIARSEVHLTFDVEPSWQSEPLPVRFGDRDAIRIRRRLELADGTRFAESTLFLRDGWLHHLYAVRITEIAPTPSPSGAWFPEILDAFVETEGPIDYTFEPRTPLRDEGPGWRVRPDVYEDATWGLSVASSGFELLWAEASPDRYDGWIVTLRRRRPDAWVSLRPSLSEAPDDPEVVAAAADALRVRRAANGQLRDAPPLELEVMGRPTRFDALAWEASYRQHGRAGIVPIEDGLLEIMAWSPSAELTDEALAQAVQGLRRLTASERREVAEQVTDAPLRVIQAGWWARGDTLSFAGEPVTWTRPSPRWRAVPHSTSTDPNVRILGRMEAPELGLRAQLETHGVLDGQTGADVVRADLLGLAAERPDRFLTAQVAPGVVVADPVQTAPDEVCLAAATVGGQRAHVVYVWGPPERMATHAEQARGAAAGLRRAPAPFVGFDPEGRWRDPQLGFAFDPPWGPTSLQTDWRELDGRVGRLLHFGDLDDAVAVIAIEVSPYEPPAETADRLLRRHYDWIMTRPAAFEDREGPLAGRVAQLRVRQAPLGLGGTTIARLVHDGILYVVVVDHVGRRTDPDEVLGGFELIDGEEG